jgi:hypothetical protein
LHRDSCSWLVFVSRNPPTTYEPRPTIQDVRITDARGTSYSSLCSVRKSGSDRMKQGRHNDPSIRRTGTTILAVDRNLQPLRYFGRLTMAGMLAVLAGLWRRPRRTLEAARVVLCGAALLSLVGVHRAAGIALPAAVRQSRQHQPREVSGRSTLILAGQSGRKWTACAR